MVDATDPIQIGTSTTNRPGGSGLWTLLVTDELVEACQEWSQPVELKIERLDSGRITMWMRGMP